MGLSVCVIGTTFIDCKGFALYEYEPHGRNIGRVEFIHGGVGRNVAENMAAFGLPVTFVSTTDHSSYGNEIVSRLKNSGVRTSNMVRVKENGLGIWMAILSKHGELEGSISKMPDLSLLEKIITTKGEQILEQSSHIILELDLDSEITRQVIQLAGRMQKPIYGIPGNMEVISDNPDLVSGLECFICNDLEAGKLAGVNFRGYEIAPLMEILTESLFIKGKSARFMVVTLGKRGSVFYDSTVQLTGYQPSIPSIVVDTSGAGDAFFSGTVMALIQKLPLKEAVIYGTQAASLTIRSKENTCPQSLKMIRPDLSAQ